MQLQMREQRQDGVVILAPEGRLDSGKIDQFQKTMHERIREGHHRLLIDCSNLLFAASSALRVLLVTVRKLNEVDGRLALCNMNPHILGIFENSGFTRLMNIQKSFDEGLAAVRPPQADRPSEPESEPEPEATPARSHHERTPTTHTPAPGREGILKRAVLGPFRFLSAVGRFLFR